MGLRVRVDIHTGLYVWCESMMVNGCYKHYGYMHHCHSIVVVVTCMIDSI